MSSVCDAAHINGFIRNHNEMHGNLRRAPPTDVFFPEVKASGLAETPCYPYPSTLSISGVQPPSTESASSSLASSATWASARIFDKKVPSSSYSASTAPPLRGTGLLAIQRPIGPPIRPTDGEPTWLPCEFEQFNQCTMRFRVEQVDAWIDHIVESHLHRNFPRFSLCWFCNEEFDAGTNVPEDCERKYGERMRHHVLHFQQGLTHRQMRPDHHFLDHVYDHGLIDPVTFEAGASRSEVPPIGSIRIETRPPTKRASLLQCDFFVENPRSRKKHASHAAGKTTSVRLT